MLNLCIKLLGCIILFCLFTMGAGESLSIQYGLGQPWMYFIMLIGVFFLVAINARLIIDN